MHDELQPDEMNRQQHQRNANQGRRNRQRDDRNVKRDQVQERALNVLEDVAAFANGGDDRREVVVEEDEIRRRAGHVGPPLPHGDADVGPAQRGRVVDAVTRHRDDGASLLQRVDDQELLFGADAREYRRRAGCARHVRTR